VRIYDRAILANDVSALYQSEAPPIDTRSGLIAYYPFTSNSNDESGNGNHGSRIEVQPTTDRNGENLRAYAFNGNSSFISASPSTSLNSIEQESDITLSAWCSVKSWNPFGVIINKSGSSDMHYRFLTTKSNMWLEIGELHWSLDYSGPNENIWHHVAAVRSGNKVTFYLNGINIGSSTSKNGGWRFNKDCPLEIGRDAHGPTEWSHGKLDEVRVYNRALHANEIYSLFDEEKPLAVFPAGQVAYYPLNGSAADFSTYKNNAANKGALLLVQDRFNKGKSAAFFDGVDDYLTVPSTPSLELINKEITLMAWVRPKPGFHEQPIISKYDENAGSTPQYRFGYNPNGLYFGFNSTANNYIHHSLPFRLVADKWQHIAVTYNGVYVKYYVNGKLNAQVPQRGAIDKNTMIIQLGRDVYGATSYYHGYLDEVRIFNKALTEREILDYKGLDPILEQLPNPTEPLIVDGFDYPIGDRGYDADGDRYELPERIPENVGGEKNFYFPINHQAGKNSRRLGLNDPKTNEWRNEQDVGTNTWHFNNTWGVHPGEDWNFDAGNADVGEPVYAVANGKVLGAFSTFKSNSWGYTIVVEHQFPSGAKIFSIYTHVTDKINENGELSLPSFKADQVVKKGEIIARVAQIKAPHLHFEIRTKLEVDNIDIIKQKLYQNDNGLGYYTDEKDIQRKRSLTQDEMKIAYDFMVKEGIIDPSDFIDENRIIESSNFGNRILLGQFNSNIQNVPVLFTLKKPSEIVTQISDAFVDFGDPNIPDLALEVVANSLKQVGQGKWMFRINKTIPIVGLDLSKQYTLVFKVKKADGSQAQKRAFNQVLFQDFDILKADVKGSPYEIYIESGIKRGLYSGFGTKFNTGDAITRGALATFVVRAWTSISGNSFDLNEKAGSFDNISESNSLYPFVQTLRNKGVIDLMPLFDEKRAVSLEEAAEVVCKLFNIKKGNAEQFKRKLPIIIENSENKYLDLLLNCFVSRNGLPESVIGSVDIANKVFSRGVMAKLVVNALRYSLVGGIGIITPSIRSGAITLSEQPDSSFSRYSIIGDKREQFAFNNSVDFTHPFKLDTIYIRPGDSISIGSRTYKDLKGNSLFYHWVSNNGSIFPIDPTYAQIKFTPDEMKLGDTAILYSYITNDRGDFSEGWITIIVDSVKVSKSNEMLKIDSVFTNFGTVKIDSIFTKKIKIYYPANGQGALLGKIELIDSAFSLKGNAFISVLPGEVGTIEVQFSPKVAGVASGILRIWHNSQVLPNPMLLSLYGFGVDSSNNPLHLRPIIVHFPCDSLSTNGIIELDISDSNLIKTIVWFRGLDSIASGRQVQKLGFGDYSFKIKDTANKILTGHIYLPLNNSLHAEWSTSSATCGSGDGNLEVTVSGGSGQYRYTWSIDSSLNEPKIIGVPGNYQIMVFDSLTGCKASFQERINSKSSDFDFHALQLEEVCGDSLHTIILRVNSNIGPIWFTFPNVQPVNDTLFRIPSGNYLVFARDSIGCSATQTIITTDNPSFRFGISAKESICSNPAEVLVTAAGGSERFQYKWDDGNFGDSSTILLSPGLHQIQVTDGKCTELRYFSITTRNPQPYFTTDSIDVELGAVVAFKNKSAEPASYRWFLDDEFTSSAENWEYTPEKVRVYKVALEATVNNCVDTFFQDIKVYPNGVLSSCLKRTLNSGWFGQSEIWQTGIIPNECDSVVVLSGDTLRLEGTRKIRSLYVEDGGVLEISDVASTMVLGDSLNTTSNLIIDGKIIMNGGTLRVHGKLKLNSLSNFTMNSGVLIIDKNTADTSGLEDGTYLFEISEDVVNFLFEGGVLQIVNPPGSKGAQAIGCSFSFGDNTTLMIGDGKSNMPSNNPNGFGGDQLPAKIGRLIIDSKTTDGNRHFTNKKPLSVKSEVRVISGKLIQDAMLEVRQ
jgi:murein DD-endopeptidase MepM/ murein hydrolase activator NlpD